MKDTHVKVSHGLGGPITRELAQWALGMQRSGILSIIHIPHFGILAEVNACIKNLLEFFHEGYLWLDTKVPVTMQLISQIIGFPMKGVDPSQ